MTPNQTYFGVILTLQDALLILDGVRCHKLPPVKERLRVSERNKIRSGSIFAWNESQSNIKRWTDGKNWLASKIQGPFLIYLEHDSDRAIKPGGLVKQSFSMKTKQNEKYHLIAYYHPQDRMPGSYCGKLPSQDPNLLNIGTNWPISSDSLDSERARASTSIPPLNSSPYTAQNQLSESLPLLRSSDFVHSSRCLTPSGAASTPTTSLSAEEEKHVSRVPSDMSSPAISHQQQSSGCPILPLEAYFPLCNRLSVPKSRTQHGEGGSFQFGSPVKISPRARAFSESVYSPPTPVSVSHSGSAAAQDSTCQDRPASDGFNPENSYFSRTLSPLENCSSKRFCYSRPHGSEPLHTITPSMPCGSVSGANPMKAMKLFEAEIPSSLSPRKQTLPPYAAQVSPASRNKRNYGVFSSLNSFGSVNAPVRFATHRS